MSNTHLPQIATLIEQALELEEIDLNLFRSKSLWLPVDARGVFGGQVVGLALSAATKTVDPSYHVHSLHSYFLLPGDNSIPIVYRVYRVRDGKAYTTRMVHARQRGKIIFTCICSFQRPEDSILDHQYPMPNVPPPEEVRSTVEQLQAFLQDPNLPVKYHKTLQMRLQEPIPIEMRVCQNARIKDWVFPKKRDPKQFVWMRAKGKLPDDLRFHHCVAAYCSDHYLLTTALLAHGITAYSNPRVKMLASLDHAVWFHAPFRADEWLLYEMESSRTISGRGLTFGRIFTRDGKLVASTAQEGVVRAGWVEQHGHTIPRTLPSAESEIGERPSNPKAKL